MEGAFLSLFHNRNLHFVSLFFGHLHQSVPHSGREENPLDNAEINMTIADHSSLAGLIPEFWESSDQQSMEICRLRFSNIAVVSS
ncbi:hypothetical protein CEXT_265591 [Caerostris extrusa]|uniref:Uncharacterized protein n=1 Tax=Caerostris extrusa TaxID=172846 RepID=A0AAV4N130_CAEEX|nr:hypothetical protein CEXT_265591 [Caerostris extrusa]